MNGVIFIEISAHIVQVSGDEVSTIKDSQAVLYESDHYSRLVYKESDGVEVILDFSDNELSIKRIDDWLTQGIFSSSGKGTLLVQSAEGTMTFDARITEFESSTNSLHVSYDLYQESILVNKHIFKCKWILEG